MESRHWIELTLLIGMLLLLAFPIGRYTAAVLSGQIPEMLLRVESRLLQSIGVDAQESMNWKTYLFALLSFNFLGCIFTLGVLMLQQFLPLNPGKLPGLSWDLALNTAVSFATNTNWQAYSGESTLSYFSQMVALASHNFTSAAIGYSVFAVIVRGLSAKQTVNLGNFWVDLTRSTVYILIPFSLVFAIILIGQGVVQTFLAYHEATTLEGIKQIIPVGPVASQLAIKQLGTNGGGFFGVNSAHPFENPTPLSNFLSCVAILLLPLSIVVAFGRMVGDTKHSRVLILAMMLVMLVGLGVGLHSEFQLNQLTGTSMEGKEVRFGVFNSVVWSNWTTLASNGSVNAMHDSLSPLAGLVALFNMQLGETIFGGVGSGMYGLILQIILTVFVAGLMVGRTPEYQGKKIEKQEIIAAMFGLLLPSVSVLLLTAVALSTTSGTEAVSNHGPHGLSQVLYAFTSQSQNNGSAFAGLGVNTPFYNVLGCVAMIVGRFGVMVPVIWIAGSLARKRQIVASEGTFRTDSFLFGALLLSVIVIMGALTFLPVLVLGPGLEHLLLQKGMSF
ncbi:MAG: potassium-transporting ATPase subunit KdpA [Leptospirales bacterium]|nr:potassium-transporting ATPase subunit KdpA [Leptospirales bacterium]